MYEASKLCATPAASSFTSPSYQTRPAVIDAAPQNRQESSLASLFERLYAMSASA